MLECALLFRRHQSRDIGRHGIGGVRQRPCDGDEAAGNDVGRSQVRGRHMRLGRKTPVCMTKHRGHQRGENVRIGVGEGAVQRNV